MPSGFTAEQLAAVVRAAGEAIVVMRPDETVVFANDAAAVIFGAASGEALVGLQLDHAVGGFDLLDEDGRDLAPEKHTVPRVLAGERQARAIERLRPKSGGSDRWTAVTSTAMYGADGGVEYVVTVLRDVTAQKRAEASLAFLSRASAVLGSSLDDGAVLAQLARLCVPEVADGCAVFLVPPDGACHSLAVTSLEPDSPALARRLSALLAARGAGAVLDG
ncbi:MAG: PAS domain-containing protein, partial [Deltaproteobacteria bacterium]